MFSGQFVPPSEPSGEMAAFARLAGKEPFRAAGSRFDPRFGELI
jgi:hypothetical protein